ncbi:molybdopterin biosynthesis protein [Paradesulfitobacterium ferrireducens]|uniref:molybdopterin biosynthesis protein n=1 Tax=Paradesulfitobacterium ferrireducens TaxID=2816476 RepID=UPI001A8E804D|nr:molybdopterin biosynthesis protein [Paradesulfitobacterium ferrireducens]
MVNEKIKKPSPSIDEWLKEAKTDPAALQEGMFLVHNGVVRQTPKTKVRQGIDDGSMVKGMEFAYDASKVDAAGDDIMYVLIGGDIRPHVVDALQFLVGKIKSECVTEIEQK